MSVRWLQPWEGLVVLTLFAIVSGSFLLVWIAEQLGPWLTGIIIGIGLFALSLGIVFVGFLVWLGRFLG